MYTALKNSALPRMLPSSGGVNILSTISLATALLLNDVIQLMQLGADASNPNGLGPTVIGIVFDVDQLDSNGAPTITLDVGDQVTGAAATPQRFFAASTIAQAGGYAVPTKNAVLGYQPFAGSFGVYTTPSLLTDQVYATVHAAPATFKAGTMRFLAEVTFDP
jgi:hypothetical protein